MKTLASIAAAFLLATGLSSAANALPGIAPAQAVSAAAAAVDSAVVPVNGYKHHRYSGQRGFSRQFGHRGFSRSLGHRGFSRQFGHSRFGQRGFSRHLGQQRSLRGFSRHRGFGNRGFTNRSRHFRH